MDAAKTSGRSSLAGLAALAVIAYALANVAHEGAGHGGACLLAGGRPVALSSTYFDCDTAAVSLAGRRWIAAAGTLANALAAVLAWLALRALPRAATRARYFAWLVFAVDAMQAAGYWLFSGLGGVGDWEEVVGGAPPLRAVLAVAGAAAYAAVVVLSLRELSVFVGAGEERVARARALCLVPYLAGGALYLVAGLLNPLDPSLVLISAAAASLGGTSGLAWMYTLLRGERVPPSALAPLELAVPPAALTAAALVAGVYVLVLGRAVRF